MISKDYAKKLASLGFAIIPCTAKKAPIEIGWTTNPIKTPEQIAVLNPSMWGCIGGINDIECIDVDLKVFTSLEERSEWWNEYWSFLSDNIEDLKNKVCIAKTMKGGYHIIYKTKTKKGNTKIASLKGHKEAIIETRGVGGQFILYGNFLYDKEYHHIDYITEQERDIIWTISKTYNYIDEVVVEVPKKSEFTPKNETDVSPWVDYNSKHTALDLIQDEFKIVRNTSKSYVIKRNGAESPHSGYVFKDSGCMFLFSTGTIYPNETLLSPFIIYSWKYHNGDFNKSASQLYDDGYGTRSVAKLKVPKIDKPIAINRELFPIEIFPKEIQYYIVESSRTLGLSIDYMGCCFLWIMSLIIGNSMVIEIKPGWREIATLWIAVVGKPGIGKTPSLNQMLHPLRKLNVKEQKDFAKKMKLYEDYCKLEKKEREHCEEIKKPRNKQFIVGDITLESLIDVHEGNPNGLGVFKDELAGWFKDMNKYRAGSDLEFWLSSWSGTSISVNRKTSKNSFVDKPFIPVIGGIQPSVFEMFATGENKDNGFIDRILISYPELIVNKYNKSFMDSSVIQWYSDFVVKMKTSIDSTFLKFDDNDEIIPNIITFSNAAEKEWIKIFDKFTDVQNSDDENEYMKSMLPKQKAYIPRFALILNVLWSFLDDSYYSTIIDVNSINRAEQLSNYFVNMAKLVKQDAKEKHELIKVSQAGLTPFDKFKSMYSLDNEVNRTVASELLEVSKRTIFRWVKELETNKK